MLYNLISNALKFTEYREIRVTAEYDGDCLIATVTDTGIGMSADVMANLFSKFNQADTSTTRKFGGTGLGLAICKQLAELMGGSISVTSAEGRGSAFAFRAPLARVGEARAVGHVALQPALEAEALNMRVLAAEDNSINQLVLKTLLHQIGLDPVVVENGQLAADSELIPPPVPI